jgi:diguanylate cyclase (GGDEF)-like protein
LAKGEKVVIVGADGFRSGACGADISAVNRLAGIWRLLGGTDAPSDPRWRASIAFLIAGGLAAVAGTLVPDPDTGDHRQLLALALACFTTAGVLVCWRAPPEAVLASLPAVGVLMVSAAVAVSEPLAATPAYYLLPLLASAYFGTVRRLVFDLVLFAVSFVLVLALWVEPEVRVAIFLGTAIPGVCVAAMMASVRQRLDAHVAGLQRLAATDALTGTLNHGAFRAELDVALERARAGGEPLSLLLIDIDHFKAVNDSFGHLEGDRMLRLVSALLVAHKRRDDALGRVGGEEFALLLRGAHADAAQRVAARIRSALRAETLRMPASLTLSVGIAERSDAVATSDALLEAADRALYLAKDRGRDQAVLVPVAA